MRIGHCRGVLTLVALLLPALPVPVAAAQQVTSNALVERWNTRNTATVGGTILWTDRDDVFFYDGSAVSTVQARGGLTAVSEPVFTLGTGAAAGELIGAWRRDTDFAWVWTRSAGGATTLTSVNYTNPISAADPMNPEAVAVADGCVFMILQAFAGAQSVKHVYRIDPATGNATNLTGTAPVPGAARITTSGCKAAWVFDDGTGTNKLQLYDGTQVGPPVDSGDISIFSTLVAGRLVYAKVVSGIRQIFLYDSTAPGATPVPLTSDSTGSNDYPRTDGRHVGWLHLEADGTTRNVVLNGGLTVTRDAVVRPSAPADAYSFQLQRGQMLWKDTGGTLRYFRGGLTAPVDIAPATTVDSFWLADGYIAWLGLSSDGGVDAEVFRFTGTPPADSTQPAAPLLVVATATPGSGQVSVSWDRVIGGSSYNIYLAEEPGVTKDNYLTLRGGRRIPGVSSPQVVAGLDANKTYSIVITTVEGGTEGPGSPEARATLLPAPLTWMPVGGLSSTVFRAVVADPTNPLVAFAAGGNQVYKTTDGGFTWTALSSIASFDIRALGAYGQNVYAASRQGDLFRSTDGGVGWLMVADGTDIGEQVKSLAIDPENPNVIYAGDFQLPGYDGALSYVVKSTDGGTTWTQLPEAGDEIRAYTIALGPSGLVYAGGTGTPNLVKSTTGGTTWTNVTPGVGFVYAAATDRLRSWNAYVGLNHFSGTPQGIYRTTTGGLSWTQSSTGLPTPLAQVNCLFVDPANPDYVHACAGDNYVYSLDGGATWTAASSGLTSAPASFALTGGRHLIAATGAGLFLLDLGPPPTIGTVAVSALNAKVLEGNSGTSLLLLPVSLSLPSTQTVTVQYQTSDTTATAGSDYTSTSGSLSFAPGETAKVVIVPVTGDTGVEPDETFTLTLSNPVNATLGTPTATGTIVNDDSSVAPTQPRIIVYDRAVTEGNALNAAFRVDLTLASTQTVTVLYQTFDGTASAGSDYTSTSGTLTFTPGRMVNSVYVPITTDGTVEGDEIFYLRLSNASNATILDDEAVGVIGEPPAPADVPMYRAYNPNAFYHFFTTAFPEFAAAVAAGYQDESVPAPPFKVPNVLGTGKAAIHRMYNPVTGRHYYTANSGERDILVGLGWAYEKDEGFVYSASGTPGTAEVFKLYNNISGVHLYTVKPDEKDAILATFPGIWFQHTSLGYAVP